MKCAVFWRGSSGGRLRSPTCLSEEGNRISAHFHSFHSHRVATLTTLFFYCYPLLNSESIRTVGPSLIHATLRAGF